MLMKNGTQTNNQSRRKPAGWARVVMHAVTEDWIQELDPSSLDAFEISGSKWENFGFRSYQNSTLSTLDICEERPEGQYDLIIAEQVWEHLKCPYRATKNVLDALRPGGYFLVTVPFFIRSHPHPLDCTRWSADGLRYFLEETGFSPQSIRTDQWGNRECAIANMTGWPRYDARFHNLNNDDNFPVVVWALAQKPGLSTGDNDNIHSSS